MIPAPFSNVFFNQILFYNPLLMEHYIAPNHRIGTTDSIEQSFYPFHNLYFLCYTLKT